METPIVIRLHTAQKWLYKLGYEFKDVRKNIFINRHERSNIVENYKIFLKKIEELKPYIIEFEENSIMKSKIYPPNCAIRGDNCCPIIMINYNKCIFSANDGV